MSEVKSKVPGVVDEVKASAGDKIEKGQVVIVLEAMKMKMPVASPEAGIIKLWRSIPETASTQAWCYLKLLQSKVSQHAFN